MNRQQADQAENRRYLTTQEVADILQVRVETVRRYIKRGLLPAAKLGRDYRIAAEDVDQLLHPQLREAGAVYQVAIARPELPQDTHQGSDMWSELPDSWPIVSSPPQSQANRPTPDPETQEMLDRIWAATTRMSTGQPQSTPEEIEEATRNIEEIMSELRANPPYPTVEAFMAASRGYPHDLD